MIRSSLRARVNLVQWLVSVDWDMHTPEGSLVGNGERPDLLSVADDECVDEADDEEQGAEDEGDSLEPEDAVTNRWEFIKIIGEYP